MKTKPGEVYMVDLGIGGKVRPMMVVSREDDEAPRALAICVPITTAYRGSKYEVQLPRVAFLREQSYANTQGIMGIEHHELSRMLGRFRQDALESVRAALKYALGL
jgi:mRNA interferase MazF